MNAITPNNHYFSELDSLTRRYGELLESGFRECRIKGYPQYKYFIVPIYKACVGKVGEVAATGISFLAADLILHQLLPKTAFYLFRSALKQVLPNSCAENLGLNNAYKISYSLHQTIYWSGVAIPVMYAKYRRNQESVAKNE